MSADRVLDSASGLRPASAFVVIGAVLFVAAGVVTRLGLAGEPSEGPRVVSEAERLPEYSIVDRDGRPMALFVQRLDLVMSPNAMWQAHTPLHMAEALSAALGGDPDPHTLLARMMPDAEGGVVVTDVSIDDEQAERFDRWLRVGLDPEAESPPVDGMWLEPREEGGWALVWQPAVCLTRVQRERHLGEDRPLRWARRLADGIAACLWGDGALGTDAEESLLRGQREAVWEILMPTRHTVALEDFDASNARAVLETLRRESVARHQMRIDRGRSRKYPAGRLGMLGAWGFLDREAGEILALESLGFPPERTRDDEERAHTIAELSEPDYALFERRRDEELAERHPISGLELACDRLLTESDAWSFLDRREAAFEFRLDRPVRKRRRPYFIDARPASPTPSVRTTLDALLQHRVAGLLDELMVEHDPAVAMAIVVELATGDVLAIDARSAYEIAGYAPLYHTFTPGSTFKVLTMACALEAGAVHPHQIFDVGYGGTCMVEGRTIHEAEGHADGEITAGECLAFSSNAGMAQIGLLVDATTFRGKLVELGYGRAPDSLLAGERGGWLPPLPWKRKYTHASISFGHELRTTLWQHAAGLAAVLRGGGWRPLQLVDSVAQGDRAAALERPDARRVFAARTCDEVRTMMHLGSQVGTGESIAGPGKLPGLIVGTKTGTAEKVPAEICLHAELEHHAAHVEAGTRCSKACRRTLAGRRDRHRKCYTSSMCIFGHRLDDDREVMVLVVVDEPRGREKFGSKVAGPTAARILEEALGVTTLGERPVADLVHGFALGEGRAELGLDQPWAEVVR